VRTRVRCESMMATPSALQRLASLSQPPPLLPLAQLLGDLASSDPIHSSQRLQLPQPAPDATVLEAMRGSNASPGGRGFELQPPAQPTHATDMTTPRLLLGPAAGATDQPAERLVTLQLQVVASGASGSRHDRVLAMLAPVRVSTQGFSQAAHNKQEQELKPSAEHPVLAVSQPAADLWEETAEDGGLGFEDGAPSFSPPGMSEQRRSVVMADEQDRPVSISPDADTTGSLLAVDPIEDPPAPEVPILVDDEDGDHTAVPGTKGSEGADAEDGRVAGAAMHAELHIAATLGSSPEGSSVRSTEMRSTSLLAEVEALEDHRPAGSPDSQRKQASSAHDVGSCAKLSSDSGTWEGLGIVSLGAAAEQHGIQDSRSQAAPQPPPSSPAPLSLGASEATVPSHRTLYGSLQDTQSGAKSTSPRHARQDVEQAAGDQADWEHVTDMGVETHLLRIRQWEGREPDSHATSTIVQHPKQAEDVCAEAGSTRAATLGQNLIHPAAAANHLDAVTRATQWSQAASRLGDRRRSTAESASSFEEQSAGSPTAATAWVSGRKATGEHGAGQLPAMDWSQIGKKSGRLAAIAGDSLRKGLAHAARQTGRRDPSLPSPTPEKPQEQPGSAVKRPAIPQREQHGSSTVSAASNFLQSLKARGEQSLHAARSVLSPDAAGGRPERTISDGVEHAEAPQDHAVVGPSMRNMFSDLKRTMERVGMCTLLLPWLLCFTCCSCTLAFFTA
jgi:hypothetical protein